MSRLLVFVVLAMWASIAGCRSVFVGGALGLDAGTLGASGIATGIGAQLEVIGFNQRGSFGIGPVLQLAGYSSSGDGDPIALTTLDARFRAWDQPGGPLHVALGTGLGVAWSPGIHHAAMPLQIALGLEQPLGRISAELCIRERFVALIGSGLAPARRVQFGSAGSFTAGPFEHRGCVLSSVVRGHGYPVLLIQGVGIHGDGWLPQVDQLRATAACLTFDNRGMGLSGRAWVNLCRDTGCIHGVAIQQPERINALLLQHLETSEARWRSHA